MKLLLTSNGFSNQAIADSLFEMAGKRPEELSLVFIPTASNVETGDKRRFIDDLANIKKQNFKCIRMTDISAVPEDIWKPQVEGADVLFFEGGNTYHLMTWMNKSGLAAMLPELLKTKIYVGLSAGSMITAPNLDLRLSQIIYGEEIEQDSMKGLGLVDFYFLPHLNNPTFASRIDANVSKAAEALGKKTYALADQSALKVINGHVEHVGGGRYLTFN